MTIHHIIDEIYIGDIASLMNPEEREARGIETMLCCAREVDSNIEGIVDFMWLPLTDQNWISPEDMRCGIRFIEEHRPVLVACSGGVSRSAGMILAYMVSKGWDLNDALNHMRKIRPIVNPHPLIMLSIRKYFNLPKW